MLLLLLGILIGWVTLPLVVWIIISVLILVQDWLYPIPDQDWKPGKK